MRVGIALGGGAARGLAHIGVLEVLEENGVPVHFITGTSIGAVIGGYYALHKNIPKLKASAKETIESQEFKSVGFDLFWGSELPKPFRNIVSFVKERYIYTKGLLKPYIVEEDALNQILERLFGDAYISDAKLPFAALAVDLINGEDKIIKNGRIKDAVRASVSIPGLFPKVGNLVDGGVTSIVPTQAAKELGADFVIASSVMKELEEPKALRTAFHINLRVDEIIKYRLNLLNLKGADVIIAPEVQGVHWADFSKLDFCIEKGRETTLRVLPRIKRELSWIGRVGRWVKSGLR